jgi:hypothetical protein
VSGALVSSLIWLAESLPRRPLGASEKRGLSNVSMAVLSPCYQNFRTSHSFFALLSRTLCSSVGIATPRLTPPLGLPGCRRYHRAHFRPCRWSIRSDHLRRTESRVRPVRHLNYIHGLLSSSSPSSPCSLSPIPYRRCPRKGSLVTLLCFTDGKRRQINSARRLGVSNLYRQS